MECIFCKIIKGEVPAKKVYEDNNVLAFHDINPQAPIHILIIPKKHYSNILQTELREIEPIFSAIKNLVSDLGLEEGFRIVNNCGELGGQTVDHVHFHLLGKRKLTWPPG
ncbi:histidine triad nucleotide-binding protein [Anaerobranca gottschalkii]|uniref:Histidine triad (HIT) family protein n=1 Tax=Anaerobranca gottschalkii DSM 13577 TaxID=1120990 RepID=A0A1H9YCG5_9FIRM|nr:histidine triad nucleotide-binding protein [Anaerobranca gottschalkii]SES66697.1 histidine triad (HIT) family protein [Anaerobranca gottschalkii DSM 13577]